MRASHSRATRIPVTFAFAQLLISSCIVTRAIAQTGDGYVGVFGDAAGTIRCMHVPPYVPTAVYVVAKTGGATASGIKGAEFRIEFSNPATF